MTELQHHNAMLYVASRHHLIQETCCQDIGCFILILLDRK